MDIRQNFRNILFWTIVLLVAFVNGMLTLILVNELFNVLFDNIDNEYFWGAEAQGWFYATKNTYLVYEGIWATIFLIILFFQIYFIVKKNKEKVLYTGLTFILLLAVMMVTHGQRD